MTTVISQSDASTALLSARQRWEAPAIVLDASSKRILAYNKDAEKIEISGEGRQAERLADGRVEDVGAAGFGGAGLAWSPCCCEITCPTARRWSSSMRRQWRVSG